MKDFHPWRVAKHSYEFWVDARPQGKERHIDGGRSTLRTRAWENQVIGSNVKDAIGENDIIKGFIGVRVTMYFKSLKKKPDIDNVIKSLYDGMNGLLIVDDEQIIYEEHVQRECVVDGSEGMWVEILQL